MQTSRFEPQTVSTPLINKNESHTAVTTAHESSNTSETAAIADKTLIPEPISLTSNNCAVGNTYQYPINPITFSPLKDIPIVVLPYNSIQGVSGSVHTIFSYTPIIANIPEPTPELTKTNAKKSRRAKQLSPANNSLNCLNNQIESGKSEQYNIRHVCCHEYNLDTLDPKTIAPPVFEDGAVGFTPTQKDIFDQQLRMHVQLATQGFLQTYKHPEIKKRDHIFKEFLVIYLDLFYTKKKCRKFKFSLFFRMSWTKLSN